MASTNAMGMTSSIGNKTSTSSLYRTVFRILLTILDRGDMVAGQAFSQAVTFRSRVFLETPSLRAAADLLPFS